jgi:hypothetical protein
MAKRRLFIFTLAVGACGALGVWSCSKDEKTDSTETKTETKDEKDSRKAEKKTRTAKKTRFSPEMMAWTLGSKLSLTAMGYSRGVDQGVADRMMNKCQIIAKALGTQAPPLFKRTGKKTKDMAAAIHYVLATAGKPIGKHLSTNHSSAAAALFELALKSNLLHLLYIPSKKKEGLAQTIVKVIKSRLKSSGLPAKFFAPLITKVEKGAPSKEVQATLRKLHKAVQAHLSPPK